MSKKGKGVKIKLKEGKKRGFKCRMGLEYFSMYDNYLMNELSEVEIDHSIYGKTSDKELYEMICENMPESEGYGFSHRYKELKKLLKDDKYSEGELSKRIPDKEMYDEVYESRYKEEESNYKLTNESIREDESSMVVGVDEIDKGVLEGSSEYNSYEIDEEGKAYEGESRVALHQVREDGVGYADVISQIITKKFPKICREGVLSLLFKDIKYVVRERYESEGIEYLSGVIAVVDLLLDEGTGKRRAMQYKIPINYERPLEFRTLIELEGYLGVMSEEDSMLSKDFDKLDVSKIDDNLSEGSIMVYGVGVEQNARNFKKNVDEVKVSRGILNKEVKGEEVERGEEEGEGKTINKEELIGEGSVEELEEYLKSGVYLSGVRKYIRENIDELSSLSIGELCIKGNDIEALWVAVEGGKEYCEGMRISYEIVLDNGSEVKYNVGLKLINKDTHKVFKISEDKFKEVLDVIELYKESINKGEGLVGKFRYKGILVYLTSESSKMWLEELDKTLVGVKGKESKGATKGEETGVGMESLGLLLKGLMQRVRNQRNDKSIQRGISMLGVYMNGLAEEGYQVRKHPNIKGLYVVQGEGYLLGKSRGTELLEGEVIKGGIKGNKVRGGYNENRELVLISPYFIIAVDSKTFEYELLYNRLNGVMSLKEAELLLTSHGYREFKDISYALNLRNYGTFNAIFGGVNRIKGLKREGGRGLIMSGIKRVVMSSGRSDKE